VGDAEEEREEDGGGGRSDGIDEAAEGEAPEGHFFGEGGHGEGGEVKGEEAEGSWLEPQLDGHGSGESHGKNGEDDESPAERCALTPLARCGGTFWQTEDVAEGRAPFGDCLKNGESESEEEEKKDGGEEWTGCEDVEALRDAASGSSSDGVSSDEPEDGGQEQGKLEDALGAA
jgi:hypothetical protein